MTENIIVLGYLENILGKSKKKARQNYAFTCPKCNHRKPKLEINLHTNEKGENPFECWVCGFRGRTIKSLLKQLQIPSSQAVEILRYVRKGEEDNYRPDNILELPKEFQTLSQASNISVVARKVKKYLYERGLTDDDFIKYNIGYATTGEYGGRILIPSYSSSNSLNYFIGRSYEDSYNKYKNPETSKDVIFFENLINWNQPIILCEGVFDALTIKRNAIPILGKGISPALMKRILTGNLQDIYIALDKDAFKKALEYTEKFLNIGKRVFLINLEDKDPSEMGFHKFTQHIQQAEEMDLGKLLRYKLS